MLVKWIHSISFERIKLVVPINIFMFSNFTDLLYGILYVYVFFSVISTSTWETTYIHYKYLLFVCMCVFIVSRREHSWWHGFKGVNQTSFYCLFYVIVLMVCWPPLHIFNAFSNIRHLFGVVFFFFFFWV